MADITIALDKKILNLLDGRKPIKLSLGTILCDRCGHAIELGRDKGDLDVRYALLQFLLTNPKGTVRDHIARKRLAEKIYDAKDEIVLGPGDTQIVETCLEESEYKPSSSVKGTIAELMQNGKSAEAK